MIIFLVTSIIIISICKLVQTICARKVEEISLHLYKLQLEASGIVTRSSSRSSGSNSCPLALMAASHPAWPLCARQQ